MMHALFSLFMHAVTPDIDAQRAYEVAMTKAAARQKIIDRNAAALARPYYDIKKDALRVKKYAR